MNIIIEEVKIMPSAIYWLPVFVAGLVFWFRLFKDWNPRWFRRLVNNYSFGSELSVMSVVVGALVFISFDLFWLKLLGSLIITWGVMSAVRVGANS